MLEAKLAVYTDIDWTMMGPGEDLKGVCQTVDMLYANRVPIVLVTAKSIWEIVALAPRICIPDGRLVAVAESGGAVYASPGLLSSPEGVVNVNGTRLEYVRLGKPIDSFISKVMELAGRIECDSITRLSGADPQEAAKITLLPPASARLSAIREYLEVLWSPRQECLDVLKDLLEASGFYVHRSARLLHVGVHRGKLGALMHLEEEPWLKYSESIGLGDSEADRDYLEHVDYPVVVPRPGSKLKLMRSDYTTSPYPAPKGWVYSVRDLVLRLL